MVRKCVEDGAVQAEGVGVEEIARAEVGIGAGKAGAPVG